MPRSLPRPARLGRRLGLVASLVVAALAAAPATPAAQPSVPPLGDLRGAPAELRVQNLVGERTLVADAGGVVLSIDEGGATAAADDPPLVTSPVRPDSSCSGERAGASVWFRLRAPGGGEFAERTHLVVDSRDSSYPNAIALYVGSPDAPNLRSCERENGVGRTAYAELDVEPGGAVFVDVAATQGSPGQLVLSPRAEDVQPPAVAMQASTSAPQPSRTTDYTMVGGAATDAGSGIAEATYAWRLTFTPRDGSPAFDLPLTTPAPGVVHVVWPARPGVGVMRVQVRDRAGNLGSASLGLTVRDRTPPRVRRVDVRLQPRIRRITIVARCSEPGRFLITRIRGGRQYKGIRRVVVRRANRPVTVVFRHVARGTESMRFECVDAAGNLSRPLVMTTPLRIR